MAIEPTIGQIAGSASRELRPSVTATGSGGTTTASATLTVTNPITLAITEPVEGALIPDTAVTVRGTLSHSRGLDTGLTVNGMPVIIDGDQFIANHVPLAPGENTLTATATDTDGITLSDAIAVNAHYPEANIRLSASPDSGTAPFETRLQIDSEFPIVTTQFYYEGPGDVTFLDQSIDAARVEIAISGVYTFSVDVTDQEWNAYTDSVSVGVVDEEALDALLQAKWAGMKAALMAGDVQGALAYHHEYSRERYGAIYDAMGDDLAMLAGQMQAISWICYIDGTAKYRIRQNHEINGEVVTVTYYIYFSRGENGLWLIERY
jgi:hypothetical protein